MAKAAPIKKPERVEKALDILQRVLGTEYRFIFWYPTVARLMPTETVQKVQSLGSHSVKHAEITAQAITSLGGEETMPAMEPLPDPLNLREFFRIQLEYEREALRLHQRAAELVPAELAPRFREIAWQEEGHIKIAEEILRLLEQQHG